MDDISPSEITTTSFRKEKIQFLHKADSVEQLRQWLITEDRKRYSEDEYVEAILSGNRTILSQAITLVESSLPDHYDIAQTIIEKCLPYSADSIRIGITGVPGAGKSRFIETFGLHITAEGRKLAVLAIDPSILP